MNRTQDYYRFQRYIHIQRKKDLLRKWPYWSYRHEGELAKGKIHCSCPLCSAKWNKGIHVSDALRILKSVEMVDEISEVFYTKKFINDIYCDGPRIKDYISHRK